MPSFHLLKPLLLAALVAVATHAQADRLYGFWKLDGSFRDEISGFTGSLQSSGGTLEATGYRFAANQGLTLFAAPGGSYTIETSFALALTAGKRKVYDFRTFDDQDRGVFINNSILDFDVGSGGSPVTRYASTPLPNDVMGRITFTRNNDTKLFSAYLNGELQYTFIDSANIASSACARCIATLFRDVANPAWASGGFVDYLAAFDYALTPSEVASLNLLTPVPEPQTAYLLATGLTCLALLTGLRRKESASDSE